MPDVADAPSDQPPATTPHGDWRRQAIITIAVGVASFAVGTVLYRLASNQFDPNSPMPAAFGWTMFGGNLFWVGWQPVVWAVLVAASFWVSQSGTTCARAGSAIVLAPVATAIDLVIAGGWTSLGFFLVAPFLFVWIAAGMASPAALGAIAGSVWNARARPTASVLLGSALVSLAIGGSLAFSLAWQWFDVYFTLGGEAVEPSPAAADRYLLTAGMALAFLVLALVLAAVRRRAGMIWLTVAALGLAVLAALVFQVPQGRFFVSENPAPYNSDAPVCFGTSGDCPGG